MKKLGLIFIAMWLVGCATPNRDVVATDTYSLQYAYLSPSGKTLKHYSEQGLSLVFPSIPGNIYGTPGDDIIYVATPENAQRFSLVLPKDMDRRALPLTDSPLAIEPPETKVLRLGTFNFLPRYQDVMGGGGFSDTISDRTYILVYFSNAAQVTGQYTAYSDIYNHNIVIDAPGWHWLQFVETSDNVFDVSAYEGSAETIQFDVYLLGVSEA
ncbi:Uncharacterised protein [Halioglobus japonicus]|nr:Uncharacterised protein [Halioglobus japonicus]